MEQKYQWFCSQVEANKVAMFRLAKSILRRDFDAEDAVAEAVLRGFSRLDTLRKQESMKAWLMRITANEARRILARRRDEIPLDALRQESAVPHQRKESELWEHVEALPDTLRAPVVLFYYEDLSVKEIAGILSLSPGAVKTRLSRARQLLRMRIEQEERP